MRGARTVEVERLRSGGREAGRDELAVEEPLEIRVGGEPLVVTMRTPGHDHELVLGFLLGEGIIEGASDVSTIAHCGRTGTEEAETTIDVRLTPGVTLPEGADGPYARRGAVTTAACGVCGRRSIEDLLARARPLTSAVRVSAPALVGAAEALTERQPIFRRTGGSHGAAFASTDGTLVAAYEDVGRHNAVDKLVGSTLLGGPRGEVLVVSGRASFEIVQKAITARVPIVAAVGAASSLAVDLARRGELTLVGFARADRATIYSRPDRIEGP